MPEMTIRLIPDPATGKKNIIISLRGDEDALPHEHEQMHRQLVEKALNGIIDKAEQGTITIEREDEKAPPAPTTSGPQGERKAVQQGR
jgi:hypothetical protein